MSDKDKNGRPTARGAFLKTWEKAPRQTAGSQREGMMEDPVKDAELKGKISDAWDAYALADTDDARDQILERIDSLNADRALVMPLEEVRRLNREAGITDEMMTDSVNRIMDDLRKRFPDILGARRD